MLTITKEPPTLTRPSYYAYPGFKDFKMPKAEIEIPQLPNLRVTDFINTVSEHTGVSMEQMRTTDRHRHIVEARGILFFMLRKSHNLTYEHISRVLGIQKDHASILSACRMVTNHLQTEPVFKTTVYTILKKLESLNAQKQPS